MSSESSFLALPTHNGQIDAGAAFAALGWASQKLRVIPSTRGRSLLNSNCNGLLCDALNMREEHGVKWFAMLHADIEPARWWLDTLIGEAEKHGADMISAVVPIKDTRGITSTAIASDEFANSIGQPWSLETCCQFGRLTQQQIHFPDFPDTFDINTLADSLEGLPHPLGVPKVPRHGLLINTGCMVLRIDRDWDWSRVFFSTIDGIQNTKDGWRLFDISEDWLFSWRVAKQGGKVMATKAVTAIHKGVGLFPNDKPWGTVASDCNYKEASAAA